MKTRAIYLLLFCASLFVGDRLGAYMLSEALNFSKHPIARLYSGKAQSDAVILGNSRAYRHFSKKQLSLEIKGQIIDLSIPGASTRLSLALLEDYLERYGTPRVVYLEISGLVTDQAAASLGLPFAAGSKRLNNLIKDRYPTYYYAGLFSHLFSYNNNFSLNLFHKIFFSLPGKLLTGNISAKNMQSLMREKESEYFTSRAENVDAFKAMMRIAKRDDFQLRLLISPVLGIFGTKSRLFQWQTESKLLAGNIKVWDYGSTSDFRSQHFFDRNHLNIEGVQLLMALLRRDGFFNISAPTVVETKR
jgi:hypothetical protein